MPEPSDHDLMALSQNGDSGAFDTLVSRWENSVLSFLRRLSAPEPIEDLGQEVFVRVFRARESYRREASFSTWLFRIAMNVARDRFRAINREPRLAVPSKKGETEDLDLGPEESAIRSESAGMVERALWNIDPLLREALVVRHFTGLTFRESSDVLGVAESTLKTRVGRGLDELRQELTRLGYDP